MPYKFNPFSGNLDYYQDTDLSAYSTKAQADLLYAPIAEPLSWHLTGDQSSLSGTKSGTYNLSTTGTLGAGATTLTAFLKIGTGYSAPTIVAGTGAGASPTVFITGGNSAGEITLTTGTTALPNDDLFTVTCSVAFTNNIVVELTPMNAVTAALYNTTAVFYSSTNSTWTLWSNSVKLADETEYKWGYKVTGI